MESPRRHASAGSGSSYKSMFPKSRQSWFSLTVLFAFERFATNPNKSLLCNVFFLHRRSFILHVMGTSGTMTEVAKKRKALTCILIQRKQCGSEAARFACERLQNVTESTRNIDTCDKQWKSNFYSHYPSKKVGCCIRLFALGILDDITMYCGLAFFRGYLNYLQDDQNGIFFPQSLVLWYGRPGRQETAQTV
jgi:hypothetical protein